MPSRGRQDLTWGVLDPNAVLNGDEAPNLLGRIVVDVDYLLMGYIPSRPQDTLKGLEEPMIVTSCDVEQ